MAGAGRHSADLPARALIDGTLGQKEGAVPGPGAAAPMAAAGWRVRDPTAPPARRGGRRPDQATGTNEVAALTRTIVQSSALNTETATCWTEAKRSDMTLTPFIVPAAGPSDDRCRYDCRERASFISY